MLPHKLSWNTCYPWNCHHGSRSALGDWWVIWSPARVTFFGFQPETSQRYSRVVARLGTVQLTLVDEAPEDVDEAPEDGNLHEL